MKRKQIKIWLQPSDFEGNDYMDNFDCPLYRAIKRQLNPSSLSVYGDHVTIHDKRISNNEIHRLNGTHSIVDNRDNAWDINVMQDVMDRYREDPEMKLYQYYVLIEEM